MNEHGMGRIEPDLTTTHIIDVRWAENGLDQAVAWIANLVRHQPGSLIDLTDHGQDGNRIHIRTEPPPKDATNDDELTT